MRIVQITPGSGDNFYCENCIRDHAVVKAMRRAGHDALMVPLYLPPSAEEPTARRDAPIFFGGINVYLQQKFRLFRRTPRWVDRLFDRPGLLKWISRKARMTSAADLGNTMISMLRGEAGRQVKELDRLVEWLASRDRPDVVVLSNALLVGLTRRIKRALGVPVVSLLQDEDTFVDALPEPLRSRAWETLAERSADVDVFVAVSRYYAEVMRERLGLPADRVGVVYVGIDPEGYSPAEAPPAPPAIGYLSRMCRDKGLDILVEAFVMLKRQARFGDLTLRVAGGQTANDDDFVRGIRRRLSAAGLIGAVEFLPNLNLPERQAFLRTLSVLSVPERHGEALGLYILEALATGVPVVLPANGAAPELVKATGGGLLCEPDDPASLAAGLERVLADAEYARLLGRCGREEVLADLTAERAAESLTRIFQEVATRMAE